MADITITINTDNAAFGDDDQWSRSEEVARILRKLATDIEIEENVDFKVLRDSNGNQVGEMKVTKE